MSHKTNQASSAGSMALQGAQWGSPFGPWGMAIGAVLGGLAGFLGAGGRSLPKGVMSGKEARKLLGQGLSVDDVLAMGPVGSFHPGRAFRKLTETGLSEEDAYRLLVSGGQGAGAGKLAKKFPKLAAQYAASGGASNTGPMSMSAFQDLMPAILGNQAAFTSPAASQWLQSLFPAQPPAAPPAPVPPAPPGGPTPWRGFTGRPGPSPDPMLGLQGLAGPFGNGGGPLTPNMAMFGGPSRRRR